MTQSPKPLKDNDYYCTPPSIWKPLLSWIHAEEFSVDPCSPKVVKPYNIPATVRFTEDDNGLAHSWGEVGHILLNPPYSQYEVWINKAIQESRRGVNVWALLNQSNASFWQDTIHQNMRFKINFRRRIKFILNDVEIAHPRYDNCLVHFAPSDSYKNYLRSDPMSFPIQGEMVYDVRAIGR